MQLGIHVGTFRRPTLEAILDAVAEHALECVHFNMAAAGLPSMPEQIDEVLCDRIARELDARKIAMATLSGTFNMIHPSPDVRRAGLRRLEALASRAGRFGGPLLALCTGTRDPDDMWRYHPDNATGAAWADLRDMMGRALEIAERHEVTLGIEPEVANVVDSAAKARRLLDEMGSTRLKIILDGANLFHAGELGRMHGILDGAFALLGPEIAAAHAKDLDRASVPAGGGPAPAEGPSGEVAAGQGLLDYDHYLRGLSAVGFTGPLILHSLAEDDVAGCVAFLREKLGSA